LESSLLTLPLAHATPPAVLELTGSAGIHLNERVSLRQSASAVSLSAPDISPRPKTGCDEQLSVKYEIQSVIWFTRPSNREALICCEGRQKVVFQ
jgi:hypothetical protein